MNIGWMLFSFSGRLRRAWYWPLAIGITAVFCLIVDSYEGTIFDSYAAFVLAVIVVLIYGYTTSALAAKRLHDRDRSALLLLIAFVPIAGWIFPLWFLVEAALPGTKGDNRFGARSRAADDSKSARVFARIVQSDRGDTGSSFALTLLVIAAVAGFFIAKDWAASHNVTMTSPGQYVDSAFRAITDQ